jgi:hypothetical protein
MKGFSSNYLPVLIDAPKSHVNTVVPVKIEELDADNRLFGAIQQQ